MGQPPPFCASVFKMSPVEKTTHTQMYSYKNCRARTQANTEYLPEILCMKTKCQTPPDINSALAIENLHVAVAT